MGAARQLASSKVWLGRRAERISQARNERPDSSVEVAAVRPQWQAAVPLSRGHTDGLNQLNRRPAGHLGGQF